MPKRGTRGTMSKYMFLKDLSWGEESLIEVVYCEKEKKSGEWSKICHKHPKT